MARTILQIASATQRSIRLDTRKGNPISNVQVLAPPSPGDADVRYRQDHPRAIWRSQPSRIYNCHGMVFASRRSAISPIEIPKIIDEDGYTRVDPMASVLAGDVILYVDQRGDPEHSGIVVSKPTEPLGIPIVISKWGAWREVIHAANDCPYEFNFSRVEFYRVIS